MSAGLEETLRSLHESVDGPHLNRELADVLVEDIKQICTQEVSEKDIGEFAKILDCLKI